MRNCYITQGAHSGREVRCGEVREAQEGGDRSTIIVYSCSMAETNATL